MLGLSAVAGTVLEAVLRDDTDVETGAGLDVALRERATFGVEELTRRWWRVLSGLAGGGPA